ncbi:hypothetical protein [Novilysobacter erysipheiresistens]|uniref:Uncharacterized protein n=1 Tax=Novilysobacter erysipheiresistens TaxID=1749332 RepID=A0ABU7Z269_9GAMM
MRSLTKDQLQLTSASVDLPESRRIVLLEIGGRRDIPPQEHNANVYCIDPIGHVYWQIQAAPGLLERDSFVWVERRDDGSIWAGRFFGNEYVLDTATGNAQLVGWSK